MRTGSEVRSEQLGMQSFIESALHPGPTATGALGPPQGTADEPAIAEDCLQHKSALCGMPAALPIALIVWSLIAAVLWACRG